MLRCRCLEILSIWLIGDSSKKSKDFSLDELPKLLKGAFSLPRCRGIREKGMIMAYHDTGRRAFAVFHFDDFGAIAKSSISETAPMYFLSLDSSVSNIRETTSPVEARTGHIDSGTSFAHARGDRMAYIIGAWHKAICITAPHWAVWAIRKSSLHRCKAWNKNSQTGSPANHASIASYQVHL